MHVNANTFDKTRAFRFAYRFLTLAMLARAVNGSEHLFTVVLICQDLPAAHALYVIQYIRWRSAADVRKFG